MSLINDALRRAKDAQQQTPPLPAPDLPFRPVDPAQAASRRSFSLLLPAALTIAALFLLIFVWEWTRAGGAATHSEVNARTARAPHATTPASTLATQPAPVQEPVSPPSPATDAAAPVATDDTTAATNAPVADAQDSEGTNTTAMTPPAPPKPAPLRLQAIIFTPRRPSAMISGRTLFIGDKLGDLRVVAIDKDSATLAGAGQTNILSLPE